MSRPVTLFTIQWGNLPLEEMCRQAQEMGYEGLELSASHLDMKRAAKDPEYVKEVKELLKKHGLGCCGPSATTWQDSVWLTAFHLLMIHVLTDSLRQRSYVPEKIVSGTGAGDTSIAAFLTAMLEGCTLEESLHLAAATGASCVASYAALSWLKSFDELREKIEQGWQKSTL